MLRPLLLCCALFAAAICPAHAGQTLRPPVMETAVIEVARNGALKVNNQRTRLEELSTTLHDAGVTARTRISVRGAGGTPYKYIERVMERLVDGGFLPADVIP